ncbi:unnamed protein product, partial [Closterium sp. NIES-53]
NVFDNSRLSGGNAARKAAVHAALVARELVEKLSLYCRARSQCSQCADDHPAEMILGPARNGHGNVNGNGNDYSNGNSGRAGCNHHGRRNKSEEPEEAGSHHGHHSSSSSLSSSPQAAFQGWSIRCKHKAAAPAPATRPMPSTSASASGEPPKVSHEPLLLCSGMCGRYFHVSCIQPRHVITSSGPRSTPLPRRAPPPALLFPDDAAASAAASHSAAASPAAVTASATATAAALATATAHSLCWRCPSCEALEECSAAIHALLSGPAAAVDGNAHVAQIKEALMAALHCIPSPPPATSMPLARKQSDAAAFAVVQGGAEGKEEEEEEEREGGDDGNKRRMDADAAADDGDDDRADDVQVEEEDDGDDDEEEEEEEEDVNAGDVLEEDDEGVNHEGEEARSDDEGGPCHDLQDQMMTHTRRVRRRVLIEEEGEGDEEEQEMGEGAVRGRDGYYTRCASVDPDVFPSPCSGSTSAMVQSVSTPCHQLTPASHYQQQSSRTTRPSGIPSPSWLSLNGSPFKPLASPALSSSPAPAGRAAVTEGKGKGEQTLSPRLEAQKPAAEAAAAAAAGCSLLGGGMAGSSSMTIMPCAPCTPQPTTTMHAHMQLLRRPTLNPTITPTTATTTTTTLACMEIDFKEEQEQGQQEHELEEQEDKAAYTTYSKASARQEEMVVRSPKALTCPVTPQQGARTRYLHVSSAPSPCSPPIGPAPSRCSGPVGSGRSSGLQLLRLPDISLADVVASTPAAADTPVTKQWTSGAASASASTCVSPSAAAAAAAAAVTPGAPAFGRAPLGISVSHLLQHKVEEEEEVDEEEDQEIVEKEEVDEDEEEEEGEEAGTPRLAATACGSSPCTSTGSPLAPSPIGGAAGSGRRNRRKAFKPRSSALPEDLDWCAH